MNLGRLFVQMALLYPWATKEYLLWQMTIGQVVMYYTLGIELKYGKPKEEGSAVKPIDQMTDSEARALRDELRRQYGDIDGESR